VLTVSACFGVLWLLPLLVSGFPLLPRARSGPPLKKAGCLKGCFINSGALTDNLYVISGYPRQPFGSNAGKHWILPTRYFPSIAKAVFPLAPPGAVHFTISN